MRPGGGGWGALRRGNLSSSYNTYPQGTPVFLNKSRGVIHEKGTQRTFRKSIHPRTVGLTCHVKGPGRGVPWTPTQRRRRGMSHLHKERLPLSLIQEVKDVAQKRGPNFYRLIKEGGMFGSD